MLTGVVVLVGLNPFDAEGNPVFCAVVLRYELFDELVEWLGARDVVLTLIDSIDSVVAAGEVQIKLLPIFVAAHTTLINARLARKKEPPPPP